MDTTTHAVDSTGATYCFQDGASFRYQEVGRLNPDLCAALAEAQGELKDVGKSGHNKFDNYKYATLEDFVDRARPVLARHGLAYVVSVIGCETLAPRQTKNGGSENCARVHLRITLYHKSGQSISVEGYGEGQDRADKAVYKAITGGKKYLIANLLNLATTDDPEADETVGTAAKPMPAAVRAKPSPVALEPEKPSEASAKLNHRQRANVAMLRIKDINGPDKGTLLCASIRLKYAKAEETVPADRLDAYVEELEMAAK